MGHTATHGLLSQNPSELEDSMAVRSTLGSRGLRHTLLCSFQPTLWSLGQVKTYLRAVLKGSPLSREYSWGGSWSYLELVLLCNFVRTSTIPDAFVSGGDSSRDSILNALIYIQ